MANSLTYLDPFGPNLTNLFDRLNHWTFLKSASKRLSAQPCWTIFVKTNVATNECLLYVYFSRLTHVPISYIFIIY